MRYPRLQRDRKRYSRIQDPTASSTLQALKAVGESMDKPDEYFQVNLDATKELIEIAKRNGVKKFISHPPQPFMEAPDSMEPCKEDGPKAPISPYGDSKYQAESSVTAFINEPGNLGTSLRFFNVVGAAAQDLP